MRDDILEREFEKDMGKSKYQTIAVSVLIFVAGLFLLAGCGGRRTEEKGENPGMAASPATVQAVSGELENPSADGKAVDYEKEELLRLGEYKKIELDAEDLENEAYSRKEMAAEIAWEIVVENSEVLQFPEKLVKDEFSDQKRRYEEMAEELEVTTEFLLDCRGIGEESLQKFAEEQVKQRMIAKTIAVKENLDVSEAVYRSCLEDIMEIGKKQAGKKELEELEEEYRQEYSMRPGDDMLIEIVKNYVGSQARS